MGTLASGIGLVSGLDYQNIVDQLVAIEARPRDLLLQRMGRIDAQRTAYLDITARVSALLANVSLLMKPSTFRAANVSSSAPDVLSATAGANPVPGSYSFVVRSLATTHQFVSGGFRSAGDPVSIQPFTIESARARVDASTPLDELNGLAGIPRGQIRISNRSGAEAVISLHDAVSLEDVAAKIRTAGLSVAATVERDRLVLRDTSAGTGALRVDEVDGGTTAAALGLAPGIAIATPDSIEGRSLASLNEGTSLAALRDGLGIRTSRGGDDFRIAGPGGEFSVDLSGLLKVDTRLSRLNAGRGVELGTLRVTTRDGVRTEVDLAGALTVGDVQQRLQQTPGLSVTVSGKGLVITDGTTAAENSTGLKIEDIEGHAARDLGINGTSDATTAKITGRRVLQMQSVGDLLAAINQAAGNDGSVLAAIASDGQRLELQAAGGMRLSAGQSHALTDLGFESNDYQDHVVSGQRIASGVGTVLLSGLNGGRGLRSRDLTLVLGGANASVDLTGAETLSEAVERIRSAASAAGLNLDVSIDGGGTRLRLASRDGLTPVTVGGGGASELGLAGTGVSIRGGDLERRYINENTRLADLNNGRGVSVGRIRITTGSGASALLDLQTSPPETLQDVIDAVNALNINLRAEINETGDGLRLIDDSTGVGALTIVDESGTAARDLNLAGTVEGPAGGRVRDGSFEFRIDVGAQGTLQDVAAAVNRTSLASASVLNDGARLNPYRLNIASRMLGADGALVLDSDGGTSPFTTLSRAQDATVILGSDASTGLLMTSSTNTIQDAIGGLTLDLHAASNTPVTIQTSPTLDAVLTALRALVEGYNGAVRNISTASSYDQASEKRGILLGEAAPREAQRRLENLFSRPFAGPTGAIRRLADLGIRSVAKGQLEFDEQKFRDAYTRDPEAVVEFFTNVTHGAGKQLQEQIKQITDPNGVLDRRSDTLDGLKETMQSRVETLNARLDRRRERLLRQFQAMEQSLSLLQGQQAALSSFSPASANNSSRR